MLVQREVHHHSRVHDSRTSARSRINGHWKPSLERWKTSGPIEVVSYRCGTRELGRVGAVRCSVARPIVVIAAKCSIGRWNICSGCRQDWSRVGAINCSAARSKPCMAWPSEAVVGVQKGWRPYHWRSWDRCGTRDLRRVGAIGCRVARPIVVMAERWAIGGSTICPGCR